MARFDSWGEREWAAYYRRQSLVQSRDDHARNVRQKAIEADAERHMRGDKYHFPPGEFLPRDLRIFVGREMHSQVRW
jgi:hypothetical protein